MDIFGAWLIAQSASGNVAPTKTEQLMEWLTSNPTIGWGIAFFVVVAMAAAAVAALTGNLDKIIGFFDKYRPKKREITDEDRQRLRQQLIEVVLRQVVKRLEESLHHKIRLDLRRQEERQRVGQRALPLIETPTPSDQLIRREINPFDTPSPPIPIGAEVSTAALLKQDDIKGRLLILGEPGAGKTNELLALAKDLLQQAQQSDDGPIPVIFELSEWSGGQEQLFADWLSERLQDKYRVPLDVSQQWIKQNQLLPLLDGLDELRRVEDAEHTLTEEIDAKRQAKQIQCMRAINEFLDLHPTTSMVVCCRRQEYEALEARSEYLKRLNGAIYLQALDDSQIQSYLDKSNRGPLWETLKRQPRLLELARSPLFLLMLVVAYQGQPIQSPEELLNLYIEQQLGDLNNQGAYSPRKPPSKKETHHYLSWLATKLEAQDVIEFLIERLQPDWLDREADKRLYKLSFGLSFGLVGGLFGGLVVGLFVGLVGGLVSGLFVGLIYGLSFGLFAGLLGGLVGGLNDIKPVEKFGFSWRYALRAGLIYGLFVGLIYGLLGGFLGGLIYGLVGGLLGVLVGGLLGVLVGGLLGVLVNGLSFSESEIDDKQLPNQGIKSSVKMLLSFGLIVGLFGGLIVGLFGGLIDAMIGVMFGAMFGGLFGGLFPVIQHLSLRYVLHRSGVAPWNYEKFLEHAENHRFIQRVGGRYRFVHALLRQRFVERYEPRWGRWQRPET